MTAAPADLSARTLPPNIFAAVMATGIVSLALDGDDFGISARVLFWLNVGLSILLTLLLVVRAHSWPAEVAADLASHSRAPGYFTLVAGPCVLGNQCVLLYGAAWAGLALWAVGLVFWLMLTYVMVPRLMEGVAKPRVESVLYGAWLLLVVGTQAISVLACLLAPTLTGDDPEGLLFLALSFWLIGSMIYIWLIALIFHRILFLPLSAEELAPPYWINMGAMAISTLAGARLVGQAGGSTLLTELLPFLKGMTLLFWATATWWIPILLALGMWRHVQHRIPLTYEHSYWAVVFPLGMYTVSTQALSRGFGLPFLEPIPAVFVWVAVTAWVATFAGMVWHGLGLHGRTASTADKKEHPSGGGRGAENGG